jgi:hypothetical protein
VSALASPTTRRTILTRAGVWLAFALFLTFPMVLSPTSTLLGDPRIDVWNHAWGYWFVLESLLQGQLPYDTSLVGGPDGGVLYFIDTPGALAALPLTLIFGPAFAYNVVLVVRIALSGAAAQLLGDELWGRGPAGWIAGVAYASTPFLLCELSNGISEVCATQWLMFTLWAAARLMRTRRWRDWALLGAMQGMTSVVTFYYGLASAIAVAALVAAWVVARLLRREGPPERLVPGSLLAAAIAGVLTLPHWVVFRTSLADARALIRREAGLNLELMSHNAVDPRTYLTPLGFQSVDLAGIYGEPFIHTGYLRWAVVLLAGLAVWRSPGVRRWLVPLGASLVAGLGPYLWWGDDWLMVQGNLLSLPFEWIRRLLPQVAITHPLRLGLGAHAIACVLAGGGAATLVQRYPTPRLRLIVAGGLGSLILAEGLFFSAATWPLPRSSAIVSTVYEDAPEGMVLDLPVEVGTTMLTSRYFWFQTVHGQPIPYTPDVRLGSASDPETFRSFQDPKLASRRGAAVERPPQLSAQVADHIRATYGIIVVHTDLERQAGLEGEYAKAFQSAFGAPDIIDGLQVWRLRANAELPPSDGVDSPQPRE